MFCYSTPVMLGGGRSTHNFTHHTPNASRDLLAVGRTLRRILPYFLQYFCAARRWPIDVRRRRRRRARCCIVIRSFVVARSNVDRRQVDVRVDDFTNDDGVQSLKKMLFCGV